MKYLITLLTTYCLFLGMFLLYSCLGDPEPEIVFLDERVQEIDSAEIVNLCYPDFYELARQIKIEYPQNSMDTAYLSYVLQSIYLDCKHYGVPFEVALLLPCFESGWNEFAIGQTGDFGLYQITRPAFDYVNQNSKVKYNFDKIKFNALLNAEIAVKFLALNQPKCDTIEHLILSFNRPQQAFSIPDASQHQYTRNILANKPKIMKILNLMMQ